MNSGLYALAGASATATAAAWANRLLEPMTKVSNMYLGLSRAGSSPRPRPARARCRGVRFADGRWRGRRRAQPWELGRCLGDDDRRRRIGRRRRRRPSGVQAGVDDDRDAEVPAELLGEHRGDDLAQPGLEDVLGELVGTASSAVSPTTPSSRLSRMNARCWGVTVSSSTPRAALPDLGPLTVPAGIEDEAGSTVSSSPAWARPAGSSGHRSRRSRAGPSGVRQRTVCRATRRYGPLDVRPHGRPQPVYQVAPECRRSHPGGGP